MTAGNITLTSIVMVSYHTGPVLFQAVASALAQASPVELVLVDNGNPLEVVARLKALQESEPRFHLITGHGNIGFGKACNMGARAASGDALLFLNPDSTLPEDAVAKLALYSKYLRRPFMIGARLVGEDGRDQRGCRRALLTPLTALIEALHLHRFFPEIRLNFTQEPVPQKIAPIPAISGAFMFLPREDFWSIDGFDEGYFLHVEDLDLCLRFTRAGGEIYFAPDVVVTHVGSTSKATTAFIEKHKARGFIRYFRLNFASQPIALLLALDAAIWLRAGLKIAGSAARRGLVK